MRHRTLLLAVFAAVLFYGTAYAEKVWTSFTPSDDVYDIALHGNYIWCATANGPVRWDTRDMSHQVLSDIPDNRVSTVAVDTSGEVWFGSPSGVNRWNGVTWRKYSKEEGLPYAEVTSLAVRPEGGIWVGTWIEIPSYMSDYYYAVSRYDGQDWATLFNRTPNDPFWGPLWSIAPVSETDIWAIGYYDKNHLIHFDGVSWKDISDSGTAPFQNVSSLALDKHNEVWVAAGENVYRLKDGIWMLAFSEPSEISAITVGPGGDIYTAVTRPESTWPYKSSEIRCFDAIQQTSRSLGNWPLLIVNTLKVDSDNTVWAGTSQGLLQHRAGKWTRHTPSNRLPAVDIRSLAASVSGEVWVGTLQGAVRYSGGMWKRYSMADGLSDSTITALASAPDGSIWFGTKNGVCRFRENTWKSYGAGDGLADSEPVQSLTVDSMGNPWAQTNSGIFRFLDERWTAVDISGLTGMNDTAWTMDAAGSIWIGGSGEKYTDQGREVYWTIKSRAQSITWKETAKVGYGYQTGFIYPASDGAFWVGVSINSGTDHSPHWSSALYRIQNDAIEKVGHWTGGIRTPPTFHNGTLWFGLFATSDGAGNLVGGGIVAFDTRNDTFTQYSVEQGLLSESVIALTVTPDGTVWAGTKVPYLGTTMGLTRYGEPLLPVITSVSDLKPEARSLLRNYPNPFNPSTSIDFSLPTSGKAILTVYSSSGQKVRTLVSERMRAGSHSVFWDGFDDQGLAVASGVYISRLTMGKNVYFGKMLLMR